MISSYKIIRSLLFAIPPELAHNLAIEILARGLWPLPHCRPYSNLDTNVFGLNFKTPIGLSAGFDKNSRAAAWLSRAGFGFIELGTVTPLAQQGNPQPRIFRLVEDRGIINRLGFNGCGIQKFLKNLPNNLSCTAGINIGKNKDGDISDYLTLLDLVYQRADYITLNISSPNTVGLREIQKADQLTEFLNKIVAKRKELIALHQVTKPILVKISPDLMEGELEAMAEIIVATGLDGVIISNTTTDRIPSLKSKESLEGGGLSGAPLMKKSTELVRQFYRLTNGKVPIVASGGVMSGDDAYRKIKAGASLVSLYSTIIYNGFGVVEKINRSLSLSLERDGFRTIREAIGAESL